MVLLLLLVLLASMQVMNGAAEEEDRRASQAMLCRLYRYLGDTPLLLAAQVRPGEETGGLSWWCDDGG